MTPGEAALAYWLDPLGPEAMPGVATDLLAGGWDTPALRASAGIHPGLAEEARIAFVTALKELGVWLDSAVEAQGLRAARIGQAYLGASISRQELVSALMNLWELDERSSIRGFQNPRLNLACSPGSTAKIAIKNLAGTHAWSNLFVCRR